MYIHIHVGMSIGMHYWNKGDQLNTYCGYNSSSYILLLN